jgi:nucleoside 2-deoxyribosyltransferase
VRIYLAGPWVERGVIRELSAELTTAGHTITHPWWDYEGEDQHAESPEFLRDCAKLDVEAVYQCDAVVVWNTQKTEGKAVEQGLAIAWDKPIVCITPGQPPSSNIFHYLHNYVHVKSMAEAVEALKQYM